MKKFIRKIIRKWIKGECPHLCTICEYKKSCTLDKELCSEYYAKLTECANSLFVWTNGNEEINGNKGTNTTNDNI